MLKYVISNKLYKSFPTSPLTYTSGKSLEYCIPIRQITHANRPSLICVVVYTRNLHSIHINRFKVDHLFLTHTTNTGIPHFENTQPPYIKF